MDLKQLTWLHLSHLQIQSFFFYGPLTKHEKDDIYFLSLIVGSNWLAALQSWKYKSVEITLAFKLLNKFEIWVMIQMSERRLHRWNLKCFLFLNENRHLVWELSLVWVLAAFKHDLCRLLLRIKTTPTGLFSSISWSPSLYVSHLVSYKSAVGFKLWMIEGRKRSKLGSQLPVGYTRLFSPITSTNSSIHIISIIRYNKVLRLSQLLQSDFGSD